MANGYTLGSPMPTSPLSVPKKKPVLGTPGATPVAASPLPVGGAQPVGGTMPVLKPGGDLGSRTNPLYNGQPVVGSTGPFNPMGPSAPAPGGVVPFTGTTPVERAGSPPVTGGPAGAAPFPGGPGAGGPFPIHQPPTIEQTLTNQWQTGAPSNPRLGTTQGLVDQAAQGLNTGPDRGALAKQAFTDYLSQSGDQFNKDVRNITQRNAATGRLGSGMYGSDLVDTATAANRDRNYAANQLAQQTAGGQISDQFNRLGVLGNLEGQQFGQGQTGLNNLLGYGQQAFGNQLATQQQQQSLDNQQFQQLLAMLGLNAG